MRSLRQAVRRSLLLVAVASTLMALVGTEVSSATPSKSQKYAGDTVTFGGPAATIISEIQATGFTAKFKAATGATVTWIPGSAPTNLSKLILSKGGSPPFDVVDLDANTQVEAINAGVLTKFKISAKSYAVPGLPKSEYIHPGYGPQQIILRLGSCVNVQAYKEHKIPLPTSITGWFSPKLAGHIALPSPTNYYWVALMPALAQAWNVPVTNPSKVINRFKKIKVSAYFTSSSDGQTDLTDGSDWLTAISDGRCLALKKAGQDVAFVPLNLKVSGKNWPYIGSGDTLDVVKGAPNQALDLQFVRMLTYYYGYAGMMNLGYNPSLPAVLKIGRQNPVVRPLLAGFTAKEVYYPSAAALTKFNQYKKTWISQWDQAFEQ